MPKHTWAAVILSNEDDSIDNLVGAAMPGDPRYLKARGGKLTAHQPRKASCLRKERTQNIVARFSWVETFASTTVP
jgi:hypothetical protein